MTSDPRGSERRLLRRWPGNACSVHLQAQPGNPSQPAIIFNLSLLGIGIVADSDVAPGTALTIQPGRLQRPVTLAAHVRHATHRLDGRWLLGCSFPRALTIDEVQALK